LETGLCWINKERPIEMFWQNMFMPLAEAIGIQASKYTRVRKKVLMRREKTGHAPAFVQHKRAEKCVSRIQLRTVDYTSSRPNKHPSYQKSKH